MKTVLQILVILACLLLSTMFVYEIHGQPEVGIDDANIFFSYSENLAAGKGIVYANNPEKVEGFTSFLWMLIGALLFKAGTGEGAILVVSFLLLVLTHLLVAGFIGRRAIELGLTPYFYQLAYILLIALSAPYMTWMTITLMDTCLWGLVVAALTLAILSPPQTKFGWACLAAVVTISTLVRPESILVTPLALLMIWLCRRNEVHGSFSRMPGRLAALFALTLTLLTSFRLWYFGFPLPNTFYAKVSPSLIYNLTNGLGYLFEFISASLVNGLAVVLVLVYFFLKLFGVRVSGQRHAEDFVEPPYRHAAGFVLLLLFLPVLTGGDHFAMSRFYQPVFPLLCLAIILGTLELRVSRPAFAICRHGMLIIILLALADYSLFAWANGASFSNWRWESPLANEFRIAEKGLALGNRLNRIFADQARLPGVALIPAGGIARSYNGPIIDLLGLNHTRIAHYRGDRKGKKNHASFERELFFELLPDVVIGIPPSLEKGSEFTDETLKGLLLDRDFVAKYRYGALVRSDDSELKLKSFFSADFLASIDNSSLLSFNETMRFDGKVYEKLPR